tara:strand:+ start:1940 stop:2458 length:519 start_codon:yes stop_codon:yes gene_type:complete
MKIKILPVFLSIIFLIIFLIFYKGLQNSNIYTPKIDNEKNIPSFKVKLFDSEREISSEEIFKQNKFYLLNIWASWCVPCRKEHPFLMKLSNQNGLEIIGLNYKDDIKNAKIFLKKFNNPYKTIFSDNDGIISIEFGAYGVPESFLIYNNKIIKKIIGPINDKSFLEIKAVIQ